MIMLNLWKVFFNYFFRNLNHLKLWKWNFSEVQGDFVKITNLKRLDIELGISNLKTVFCSLILRLARFRHILCFFKICIKIILFWLCNLQGKWVRFIEKSFLTCKPNKISIANRFLVLENGTLKEILRFFEEKPGQKLIFLIWPHMAKIVTKNTFF